jgi:hypothetical protein
MDIDTDQLGADIDSDPANAGATAANAILGSAGVDTSGMGIQERTVAMRDMLDGLMGQTDAQEKEEFWMNMAMVGFGIAAGESSNAMKNIADGLLAGTAQISKGNAAKRDRNDQFTLTAFGEVLADQRAQEKFARDQTLAGIRAGGSGNGYRDARNPADFSQDVYKTAFASFNDSYVKPTDALPGETATQYATRMSDAAYQYATGGAERPPGPTQRTPAGERVEDDTYGYVLSDGNGGWTVDPDQSPPE